MILLIATLATSIAVFLGSKIIASKRKKAVVLVRNK